ncbi:MAG: nucleotide exchange factor GrpE [Lachnospiraceae bacterium]
MEDVKKNLDSPEESQETTENMDAENPEDAKEQESSAESETKEKKHPKKNVKSLELELSKKDEQILELEDRYRRLMAEFENARKRTEKETSRMFDMGAKHILEKLLPIVDNFERGLDSLSEEEKEAPHIQGMQMVYKQLMTTLEEVGVKPMNAVGTEFNPDYHNAVLHEDDETQGENLVTEEMLKGYFYKEDVLRHSMVKVVN